MRQKIRVKNDIPVSEIAFLIDKLQHQQVIAYPTEAVFGLGCDPDDEVAVNRLLALKQRPVEKGLILVAANYQQLLPYVDDTLLTPARREDVFTRWPGPVTFVLPAKTQTPRWLTGKFDSLAVRVTEHPEVVTLCLTYGKPLVSTSANLAGKRPCRTWQEVREQFGDDFPVMHRLAGGRPNPSEIRDAMSGDLIRRG